LLPKNTLGQSVWSENNHAMTAKEFTLKTRGRLNLWIEINQNTIKSLSDRALIELDGKPGELSFAHLILKKFDWTESILQILFN
jgi:hypothetical protein